MHGRSPVAAFSLIVALACAAALPAAASAQDREQTADQAQALSPFPVYTVTRPAGLPAHYRTEVLEDHPFCEGHVVRAVHVELRRYKLSRAQRWIGMRQTEDRCAVHGTVGKPVRTVKLFGRRVVVRRSCLGHRGTCKGQPVSHRVHTIKFSLRAGSERTFFYLDATRMSIRAMLRAVRSLRRVDLTRPVVSLREFMSSDQSIFCQIADTTKPYYTWCVMSQPFRSGMLHADGSVDVCNMDPNGCIPGGASDGVPVLHAGQTSRLAGFACTAEAAAITCTVAKGGHAGHGFRIDANAAVEVSPPG
jgi:hypothetical protein